MLSAMLKVDWIAPREFHAPTAPSLFGELLVLLECLPLTLHKGFRRSTTVGSWQEDKD